MTTILFYGEEGSKKTTWCRKINCWLHSMSHAKVEYHHCKDKDFKSKITFPKLTVSIYSAGDDQETLAESVEWAKRCKSDIHIGAVRKHKQYQEHLSLLKTDQIIWVNL